MIRIFVNNIAFYIKKDISVLEALSFLGLRVPRFCYHEALSIAGNCRICLVETDSSVKLVASCAQPILANMQIFSNTVKVLKTRENIMESLLINHPLDCPICDQAGECDLQDQSKVYGGILSRHIFSKRGVEDKIIDPCIKTIMTRCIHCTRCVRFASEITGNTFLGTLNRGRYTEIGAFINFFQDSSEVSGNVIDLCPVGALTAKPYAFKARPWELRSIETIDLTDGLGSNVYVNLKELEIISVLPKMNPNVNGQWISNKARFYVDALQRYRISSGYLKDVNTSLKSVSSINLLEHIINKKSAMTFIINDELDMNALRLLKKATNARHSKIKVYNNLTNIKYCNYYVNQQYKVKTIESANMSCFVILASNIRVECAVINIKLRIKAKSQRIKSFNIGQRMESFFPTNFINVTASMLIDVIEGKQEGISKIIFIKSNPLFVIGESFFQRVTLDKISLINFLTKYNANSLFFIINKKCNTEAIRYFNIKPITYGILSKLNGCINFCLLEDNLQTRQLSRLTILPKIWVHTHGSSVATACDYILPVFSYFESEGIFMNLENRPQKSVKIIEHGAGFIYSIFEYIEMIVNSFNINLKKPSNVFNALYYIDEIIKNPELFNKFVHQLIGLANSKSIGLGTYSIYPFKPTVTDYYLTNSYSKYSLNMLNYSNTKKKHNNVFLSLPL